jgi:hypothetical protein
VGEPAPREHELAETSVEVARHGQRARPQWASTA